MPHKIRKLWKNQELCVLGEKSIAYAITSTYSFLGAIIWTDSYWRPGIQRRVTPIRMNHRRTQIVDHYRPGDAPQVPERTAIAKCCERT